MSEEKLQKALDIAMRYLSLRPRSEWEMRNRMRRSFDADIVKAVLQELRERDLVNDTSFAQYWADNRTDFSPRSRRLVIQELRRKGVSAEEANNAVADMDDQVTAHEAGRKKARSFKGVDHVEFYKKLSSFLRNRGYSYDVIESVVQSLRQELNLRLEGCL